MERGTTKGDERVLNYAPWGESVRRMRRKDGRQTWTRGKEGELRKMRGARQQKQHKGSMSLGLWTTKSVRGKRPRRKDEKTTSSRGEEGELGKIRGARDKRNNRWGEWVSAYKLWGVPERKERERAGTRTKRRIRPQEDTNTKDERQREMKPEPAGNTNRDEIRNTS